jgi:hypothetical protein
LGKFNHYISWILRSITDKYDRPRMTLKLRRIDRGIQFKSGQEWQWKGRMEKKRTRFNM